MSFVELSSENKCVVRRSLRISQFLEEFAVNHESTGISSNIALAYWARVAAFKLIIGIDHILRAPKREAFKEKLTSLLNKKENMDNDGIRCQKIAYTLIKEYAYKLYDSAKSPPLLPKGNEMDAIKNLDILFIILNLFESTADSFILRITIGHFRTKLQEKYGNTSSKLINSTPTSEGFASTRIKIEVSDPADLAGETVENSGGCIISTDNGKRQRNEDETPTHILKKIKSEDGQAVDVERHMDPVGTCQEDNKHKVVVILSSRAGGIMTHEEIDSVRQHLLDTMINFMSGPSNAQGLRLRFINSERVEPGWFQVTTEDEGTARWLLENYTPDSVGEVNFKTVEALEAPWPQKIGIYLKSQEVDLTRIIKMIGLQNCELNVNRWKHVCTTKTADGWFVNFMVDREDARRLEALGWTLFFELGKLAVVSI